MTPVRRSCCAALAVLTALLWATCAGAAPLPVGCAPAGALVTCTYTAGATPFTVPAGVSHLAVTAVGGQGGGGGGLGSVVTGTLAVTPGSTLYAVVGGNGGENAPGANGGGPGGLPQWYGNLCNPGPPSLCVPAPDNGGGGASDVQTVLGDLSSRLLIAGGGGGAGFTGTVVSPGGGPGPGPGSALNAANATHFAPGAGGPSSGSAGCLVICDLSAPGAAGAVGSGGAGGLGGGAGDTLYFIFGGGGGGGGGGLFGGGGGGGGTLTDGGQGGHGSNLLPPGGHDRLDTTGVPLVQITYGPQA